MPLYGFDCQQCGAKHEGFCSVSERDSQVCPGCGLGPMARQLSRTTFVSEVPFSDYSAGEKKMALRNKQYIEQNASKVRSGEITLDHSARVPHELRPVI